MKCDAMFAFTVVIIALFCATGVCGEEPQQSPVAGPSYERYDEPEGLEYRRLMPPLPEGMWYWPRYKGTGNIDATDEAEEVVLVTVQGGSAIEWEYEQAFLLVCETEDGKPKLKYLLKIYDRTDTEAYQYPPFVFRRGRGLAPNHGNFVLIDLNKDGILDVFTQLWYTGGSYAPHYVSIASSINGCFERIFSVRAGLGANEFRIKYSDIDKDGIYEIEIPNEIYIQGVEHAASPAWVSLYAWDGKAYVLDDRKFYSVDTKVLIHFLERYMKQYRSQFWVRQPERYFEDYEFYLGLIYHYQEKPYRVRSYFKRVIEAAKNEGYIRAAQAILSHYEGETIPAPSGQE